MLALYSIDKERDMFSNHASHTTQFLEHVKINKHIMLLCHGIAKLAQVRKLALPTPKYKTLTGKLLLVNELLLWCQ